jgi:hypothetical protein
VGVLADGHLPHRRATFEQFTGSAIRDFIPVLVERMARDQLLAKRTG